MGAYDRPSVRRATIALSVSHTSSFGRVRSHSAVLGFLRRSRLSPVERRSFTIASSLFGSDFLCTNFGRVMISFKSILPTSFRLNVSRFIVPFATSALVHAIAIVATFLPMKVYFHIAVRLT